MLKSETSVLPKPHTSESRLKQKVIGAFLTVWSYRASYVFIAPFMICFAIFIMIPVIAAFALSFTYYNSLEPPRFVGWANFRYMFSQDLILIKYAPNTFKFATIVGPGGYIASFLLAWLISILPGVYRKWFTLAMYTPSLAGGVSMGIIWCRSCPATGSGI
ncbi:hypothetical protein LJK88_17050 [Paenibacillus sp. P26]|nr:hypothetical protein LJK88_17050 [Paenibacillus sp. P26]